MISKANIVLTEELLDSFIKILTDFTGIVPRSTHRDGVKNFIEQKINANRYTIEDYLKLLHTDKHLLSEFVNQSTVNETYFFREEKQFALLKEKLFPKWRINNPAREIKIWSAACSYGEEAYSLAVMALNCGLTPYVTASDINSDVLEHCKSGIFLGTSLRSVDGVQFQPLVLPYRRADGRIAFTDDIKKHVKTIQLNLTELESGYNTGVIPKNQNIIFLRNVFIYFSIPLRERILRAITENCLADDGYLFVSMSEIAQLDSSILPPCLEKIADGNVFYFHKKSLKTGGNANG